MSFSAFTDAVVLSHIKKFMKKKFYKRVGHQTADVRTPWHLCMHTCASMTGGINSQEEISDLYGFYQRRENMLGSIRDMVQHIRLWRLMCDQCHSSINIWHK